MRIRKAVAVTTAMAWLLSPALSLAEAKTPLALGVPQIQIRKGEAFAFSLCANRGVSAQGQGATGGLSCRSTTGAASGGCPPYKYRVADARDSAPGWSGFNAFLPPGVFLEPDGVIHGRVASIGALTRPGGVICVEDSCGSAPACRRLELKPVDPNPQTLSADQAVLAQAASAATPPGRSASYDTTAPATAAPAPAPTPTASAPASGGTPATSAGTSSGGGHTGELLAVAAGLAAVGVAVAVKGSGTGDTGGGGACGVTRSQCCSGGAGGGCGIQAECSCPAGLRDGGICSASSQCSQFFTPGRRICNGC